MLLGRDDDWEGVDQIEFSPIPESVGRSVGRVAWLAPLLRLSEMEKGNSLCKLKAINGVSRLVLSSPLLSPLFQNLGQARGMARTWQSVSSMK